MRKQMDGSDRVRKRNEVAQLVSENPVFFFVCGCLEGVFSARDGKKGKIQRVGNSCGSKCFVTLIGRLDCGCLVSKPWGVMQGCLSSSPAKGHGTKNLSMIHVFIPSS